LSPVALHVRSLRCFRSEKFNSKKQTKVTAKGINTPILNGMNFEKFLVLLLMELKIIFPSYGCILILIYFVTTVKLKGKNTDVPRNITRITL
jgi:hypothetical protein